MNRRTLLAGLGAGVVARIARVDAHTAQTTRSLTDTVADAERAFADSMAKRDINAFASHLAHEAVFFGGPDANTPLRGKAAIVNGWKNLFERPDAPFSWSPDSTEVLNSGTLAATSGPVRDPKGTVTGRFSSVWRLESDGKWRVIFDRGCQVCRCP